MSLSEDEFRLFQKVYEVIGEEQFEELMGFVEQEEEKIQHLSEQDRELSREMFLTGFIKAGLMTIVAVKEASEYSSAEELLAALGRDKDTLN